MKNFRVLILLFAIIMIFSCKEKVTEKVAILELYEDPLQAAKEYVETGNKYFLGRRYDIALNNYLKALELNDSIPQAHFNVALIYDMRFKFEEATHHYERAIKLKPDYVKAHLNFALILEKRKEFDRALMHINHVLETEPENFKALYNRAFILQKVERTEEAYEAWKLYIDKATGNVSELNNIRKALQYISTIEFKEQGIE